MFLIESVASIFSTEPNYNFKSEKNRKEKDQISTLIFSSDFFIKRPNYSNLGELKNARKIYPQFQLFIHNNIKVTYKQLIISLLNYKSKS